MYPNSGEHGFYVADSLKNKGGLQVSTQAQLTVHSVCLAVEGACCLGECVQFHSRHSSIDRLKTVNVINLLSVVINTYNPSTLKADAGGWPRVRGR